MASGRGGGAGSRPNGGRELMGADWDLCTTLAKSGTCSWEGCKWRHENAEWWEGAWWLLDDEGRSWGWWQTVPSSEECPVSLTPICLLSEPPFELRADGKSSSAKCPRHRFDATALAKYLVGSGQFMDPVNRRPLDMDECHALDKATRGVHKIAEAFAAVQEVQAAGGGRSAAIREVAVAARHLFVMPSAADLERPEQQSAAAGRGGASIGSRYKSAAQRPQVGPRDALTVHAEGGLRVVDDSMPEESGSGGGGYPAPTPAEALATASGAVPRPKRAPRPQRNAPLGVAGAGGGATCGGGRRDEDMLASPTVGARKAAAADDEDAPTSSTASGSAEVWRPAWATPELQATQLSELEQLAREPGVQMHSDGDDPFEPLRAAQARNELLVRDEPMLLDVALSDGLTARLGVPPFYPTQPATVIQVGETSPGSGRLPAEAVRALEREVRQEARRLEERQESSALTALVRWLLTEAPQRAPVLAAEARAAQRQAAAEERDGAQRAARVAQDEREAAAEASKSRLAEKYSPSWDLCAAFVKNGKCKNKNCKWRHEKPPEKPAPAETEPSGAAKAAPGGAQAKAARGSGKPKK